VFDDESGATPIPAIKLGYELALGGCVYIPSEPSLPNNLPPVTVLAEAINDGCLLVDSEWKIIYSNHKSQQMLQRSLAELGQGTLWDIITHTPDSAAQQQLTRALEQQVMVEIDVFYPHLFKWHEVRAVPAPQGLLLILRDITDRQWLIHREAERIYLRNIFMDAPVPISVTRGPHHQFEFVNHQGRKLIGGRNVEGMMVREAFPELVGQGFLEILDHVYRTGQSYYVENQPVQFDRHSTGVLEEAYFNISYQALQGFTGQVSGIFSISTEV